MAYSKNPYLPKVRARAVNMYRSGKTIKEVATHFGVTVGAVSKWNKKVPVGGVHEIPTKNSKPHHHPKQLSNETVERIVAWRLATGGRCSEVVHQHLQNEGVAVCLNSVKRTLGRKGLIKKRSPWKRLHLSQPRPYAEKPGDLVQLDTIHLMKNKAERIYVYTLLDVHSRWAYAWASERANVRVSLKFLKRAKDRASFNFTCLQSDHGSEFSQHFSERAKINHRHSRVRQPNDNAHLERFNRTLHQEFLSRLPTDVRLINRHLPAYLTYYNQDRLHLGLNLITPALCLQKCFQAIG